MSSEAFNTEGKEDDGPREEEQSLSRSGAGIAGGDPAIKGVGRRYPSQRDKPDERAGDDQTLKDFLCSDHLVIAFNFAVLWSRYAIHAPMSATPADTKMSTLSTIRGPGWVKWAYQKTSRTTLLNEIAPPISRSERNAGRKSLGGGISQ